MKQKVLVMCHNKVVYKGRIADIPITQHAIVKKSIELFDDDDPCIIHQSYVIKEYVDVILSKLKESTTPLSLASMTFLDLEDLEHCTIQLEG